MSKDYTVLTSDLIAHLESLHQSNQNNSDNDENNIISQEIVRNESCENDDNNKEKQYQQNESITSEQTIESIDYPSIELFSTLPGAVGGCKIDAENKKSDNDYDDYDDADGQQSPPKLYGGDQELIEDELIDHEYETDYSVYENKSGLADDMKFLASMPELCDITFLVGETREPVCAVRSVLAARSR